MLIGVCGLNSGDSTSDFRSARSKAWPRTPSFRKSWRRNSRPRRTRPTCAGCAAKVSTSSAPITCATCAPSSSSPGPRRGGSGVYINHEASRTSNDCYVCEIPPGKKLAPQRQLFEEMILVLDGRGSTTVWNDEGRRITFEWKAGAMFAIPLNCWHQHFNGSGQAPARYVARDQRAAGDQSLRGHRFRLQHQARLQGPLQRRARLFQRQGRAEGPAAASPTSWPTRSTCR